MFTKKELVILADCLENEIKELNEVRNKHSDKSFQDSFYGYIKEVQTLHSKLCTEMGKDIVRVSYAKQ